MGRVSLILPLETPAMLGPDTVERYRGALEAAGCSVEVLAVLEPGIPRPVGPDADGIVWRNAAGPGLASAAITGLTEARGDARLVLDPSRGYEPEDLVHLVEPILSARADLVVAHRADEPGIGRRPGPWQVARGWAGRVTRRALGISSPLSGLVAVSPALVEQIAGTYHPVGSRFTIDLLLRARGRKEEVAVRAGETGPPQLGLDDFRHLKRLADDRFGNASRLLQFCAVGASGMVVDLSCYALFQHLLRETGLAVMRAPVIGGPLDLAVSGALAIGLALTWNFALNRRLTFSDARSRLIVRQFLAYAASNAAGIALSLFLRLKLPAHVRFFDDHKLAAALVGIVAATGLSFTLARWVVFRRRPAIDLAPAHASATPTPARSFGQ